MIEQQIEAKCIKLIILWYGHTEAANNTWIQLVNFCDEHKVSRSDLVRYWKKARPEVKDSTAYTYACKIIQITKMESIVKDKILSGQISARDALNDAAKPQSYPFKEKEQEWILLLGRAIKLAFNQKIPLVLIAKKAKEVYEQLAA